MKHNNELVYDVSININVVITAGPSVWKGSAYAYSYIITTMIGPGALALPWAIAQLGWIAGVFVMILFSSVAYFTFSIQAAARRPTSNCAYTDVVRAVLGGIHAKLYGAILFLNRLGTAIGYTVISSISMVAVQRSICFHLNGHNSSCKVSTNPYMTAFGLIQMILSQYLNFDQIPLVSIVSAVMPITYTFIGLGLEIAKLAEKGKFMGSSTGVVTETPKIWTFLQALGAISFAYSYTLNIIEIQERIKSPATESEKVKKAGLKCVLITSSLKMLCGFFGYAAFGDTSPGNLLTGFGFYNPYWLVDIANVAVVVHLTVAFQVFIQPLFASVEETLKELFPHSKFTPKTGDSLDLFRSVLRSIFVILITAVAMLVPFFNYVVGILGVLRLWPLMVYFPLQIYIAQEEIRRWSWKWCGLQLLSAACLLVSVAAAAGSIAGIVSQLY